MLFTIFDAKSCIVLRNRSKVFKFLNILRCLLLKWNIARKECFNENLLLQGYIYYANSTDEMKKEKKCINTYNTYSETSMIKLFLDY